MQAHETVAFCVRKLLLGGIGVFELKCTVASMHTYVLLAEMHFVDQLSKPEWVRLVVCVVRSAKTASHLILSLQTSQAMKPHLTLGSLSKPFIRNKLRDTTSI